MSELLKDARLDEDLEDLEDGPPWQTVGRPQVPAVVGAYEQACRMAVELRGLLAADLTAGDVPDVLGELDRQGRRPVPGAAQSGGRGASDGGCCVLLLVGPSRRLRRGNCRPHAGRGAVPHERGVLSFGL